MTTPKTHYCKLGTKPALVVIVHGKPAPGKIVTVRDATPGSKPLKVKVTKVNPDGYFFCDLV